MVVGFVQHTWTVVFYLPLVFMWFCGILGFLWFILFACCTIGFSEFLEVSMVVYQLSRSLHACQRF
jgi:hypothetical protein